MIFSFFDLVKGRLAWQTKTLTKDKILFISGFQFRILLIEFSNGEIKSGNP